MPSVGAEPHKGAKCSYMDAWCGTCQSATACTDIRVANERVTRALQIVNSRYQKGAETHLHEPVGCDASARKGNRGKYLGGMLESILSEII